MPKFSKILNNFLAGEISPFRLGRTEVDGLFTNGCLEMKNAIPRLGGGFSRRGGLLFQKDVTTDFGTFDSSRLIPFVFNKEESYAILRGAFDNRVSSTLPRPTFLAFDGDLITKVSGVSDPITVSAPDYRVGQLIQGATYSRTGTTVTVTATAHGLASLDFVFFDASSGLASDGYFQITVVDPNTFTFTHGTSGSTSGSCRIYYGVSARYAKYAFTVSIQDPENNELGIFEEYTTDQLDEIQYQQLNDVLVLVQKSNPPVLLARVAEDEFVEYSYRDFCRVPDTAAFTALDAWQAQWILGVPYRDPVVNPGAQPVMNVSSATLNTSITVTISNPDVWGGFVSGHVGAVFLGVDGSTVGAVVITDVASSTSATGYVIKAFGASGDQDSWQESAWSDARGWPRSVRAFAGRLFYGGDNNTIWASQIGDIAQMCPASLIDSSITASSSEAFTAVILGNESSSIQWMDAGTRLVVGTLNREYIADVVAGQSVSSLSVEPQTEFGSAYVQALHVGNSTVFVDRTRRNIREFNFNFNDDNFRAESLSFFAEHIINKHGWSGGRSFFYPRITEVALQQAPEPIMWFLNNQGGVFGVLRDRTVNVTAWHKHVFAGEDVIVRSICVLPNPSAGRGDDLWLCIERTINGSSVQYLEKISEEFLIPFPNENTYMVFLDSAKVFNTGSSFSSITMAHLEGETIRVVGDGADLGDFVVGAGGTVNLGRDVYTAVAGLAYQTRVIPLPIEAGSALGNAQTKTKAIEEIKFLFYEAIACSLSKVSWQRQTYEGADRNYSIYELVSGESVELNFVPGDLPLDEPIPLFIGQMDKRFPAGWTKEGLFAISTSAPFPLNVAGIVVEGVTND